MKVFMVVMAAVGTGCSLHFSQSETQIDDLTRRVGALESYVQQLEPWRAKLVNDLNVKFSKEDKKDGKK